MPIWIDTHCHWDAPEFDADRDALRAAARAVGVAHCVIPAIGREYMVMGAHVSMFIYNNTLRMLTDTMPLPYRDVHVTDNILFGREPILKVKLNRETLAFLGNKEADATLKKLNPSLLKVLRGGEFTLEPLTTLYVPRRAYGHSDHGLSVYSRIVRMIFRPSFWLSSSSP